LLKLKRIMHLYPQLDLNLEDSGFVKTVYYNNKRLTHTLATFKNIFNRWKMSSQESVVFRMLDQLMEARWRFNTLRKCLWALKTHLPGREAIEQMNDNPVFMSRRFEADIEQIRKRFLVYRRLALTSVVSKFNKKFLHRMAKDAKEAFSFKRFITTFRIENLNRISTEQRMLAENFEKRGTQTFTDFRAPLPGDPCIPLIMNRVDGKYFSDPRENHENGRTLKIPGGFKISRIRLVFQSGIIIGWQTVWAADGGATDIESPKRGDWNAAGTNVQEVTKNLYTDTSLDHHNA
jgi:hypothetical protein